MTLKNDYTDGEVLSATAFNSLVSLANSAEQAANKAQPNGYASLDSGGKVPVSQLPNSIMEYQGTWNAASNTPTLADGTGNAGDVYRVSVSGTQNLGSGSISFVVSDYCIYNGSTWEKADTTDAVASVNGYTGNISLTKSDVGLGNVDNTSDATKDSAATTLSNKTLASPALTGSMKGATGATVDLHNQADTTTNYEKLTGRWNSNIAEVGTFQGGTGASREMRVGINNSNSNPTQLLRYIQISNGSPCVQLRWTASGSVAKAVSVGGNATGGTSNDSLSSSSAVQSALVVEPYITQSGTAGYTGLLVNPTEGTTGSGTKLLADFQVGGSSKAKIDNTGMVTANSLVSSSASTVTAAGTTTLTVSDPQVQIFTGTTTQTVKLPTTGVTTGMTYTIVNTSSGNVTVQSSGGNTVYIVNGTNQAGATRVAVFVAVKDTPTAAADWQVQAATSSASALSSSVALRGSVGDLSASFFIPSSRTVTTAAGTTTLNSNSLQTQIFTGTNTQTVKLPSDSPAGVQYLIVNQSTGDLTVQSSAGNTITTLTGSATPSGKVFISLKSTPTANTDWLVVNIYPSTTAPLGVGSIELGHASDTTLTRSAAGKLAVEGVDVLLSGGALGTPSSGTLTNCTGLPVGGISATGTPGATTYLRGDGTWATVSAGVTSVAGATGAVTQDQVTGLSTTGIVTRTGSNTLTTVTAPTGAVVGTSDAQALTNKDLTGAGNTFPTFNQNTTGSAATLTTSRNFQTNLGSTAAAGFNGSADNTHGVTGTLPVANGGTGVTSLSATPAASAIALWDSNGNLSADAFIPGVTSTATAAGTTTLTIGSTQVQVFTGTSTQTVKLPTTSVTAGQSYTIVNQSTGAVTVQSSGANTIAVVAAGNVGTFYAEQAAPTTAAHWEGVVGLTGTQTLTNKRLTPRINSVASSATPAINTDTTDQFNVTALAVAITSMTTNLTGTPTDGQKLMIRIKDNGTARAITWGASFASSGVTALLTTTVVNKTHLVGFVYDSTAAKWICVACDDIGY